MSRWANQTSNVVRITVPQTNWPAGECAGKEDPDPTAPRDDPGGADLADQRGGPVLDRGLGGHPGGGLAVPPRGIAPPGGFRRRVPFNLFPPQVEGGLLML